MSLWNTVVTVASLLAAIYCARKRMYWMAALFAAVFLTYIAPIFLTLWIWRGTNLGFVGETPAEFQAVWSESEDVWVVGKPDPLEAIWDPNDDNVWIIGSDSGNIDPQFVPVIEITGLPVGSYCEADSQCNSSRCGIPEEKDPEMKKHEGSVFAMLHVCLP